jgi:RNA polymerase sigma-70 factor (ECF subfamily)
MAHFFLSKKQDVTSQIEPYLEDLFRLAYHFCGNVHDAEDIVQDVVLKLHAKKIDITQYENPRTWLSKVLHRHFIDHYRRRVRSPIDHAEDLVLDGDSENALDAYDSGQLPMHEQTENSRFMRALSKALEQLNDEQRTLIILFEVEGYSLSEIQEILDLPQGTIKSRLHRAREKLRQALEIYGTDWVDVPCSTVGS